MNLRRENRPADKIRRSIWIKTGCTIAGYSGCITLAYFLVFNRLFRNEALALALTFFFVQCVIIHLLLAALLSRKVAGQLEDRRKQRLHPIIRDELVKYSFGGGTIDRLGRLLRKYPRDFEICLIELLFSLKGDSHMRLSRLAVDLKIDERWQEQLQHHHSAHQQLPITYLAQLGIPATRPRLLALLEDEDMEIRLEACRALIRSGAEEDIEQVFRFALTQTLTVRAVLVVELRPYAFQLVQNVLPEVVREGGEETLIRVLELIAAWQRALPLGEITELLRRQNPRIKSAALRVSPYVEARMELGSEILRALDSEDSEVKSAAAWAAGQLKLDQALPGLLDCLQNSDVEVVTAGAQALGQFGEDGTEILEREILSASQTAATAALEVLEQLRTARDFYVRF